MGTGGSRYGAGRPASHVKAENCRSIDVRRWEREGMLRAGRVGGWCWRDAETGETFSEIGYRTTEDAEAVILNFSLDGAPIQQRVPIERTSCRYGGDRPWFICPRCGYRRAVLFLRSAGFGCRRCNRIAYRSQSEDALGRSWLKQAKAEAKLGENWKRPKGMHHDTCERLLAKIWDCETFRDEALAAYMLRHGILLDPH